MASFIGTTIEWYDFFLPGTAAALVFDQLFFPEAEPLVGTLLAFSTYAVGFAARPLGGIVFAIVQAATSEAAFVSWIKETRTEAPKPIVDVVCKYPREVLVAMGMRVAENGASYILTVPFFGALSDRVGRRPLYLAGAVVPTLWAFPLFGLLNTESPVSICLRSWSA